MLRNVRKFWKFTKFLSNPRFNVSRTFSVDCSKTSNHNHRVGNEKLHTRNMVRAKSNDRLLRYLPRTPKKYRLALVPDLANFPLFPYYFLLPQVNLLKATQEVIRLQVASFSSGLWAIRDFWCHRGADFLSCLE